MPEPYRLALAGIDGSGKTSLVARLRERNGVEGDVATIHSPIFHEAPNAPLQLLSRQMQAVSFAADALELRELKATMLYLQMTLYGVVERSLIEAFSPRCIVSDRHAMVDTLAYGPLYKAMVGAALDPGHWEPLLRRELEGAPPHSLDATIAWHDRLAERLGLTAGFWEMSDDLAAVFDREPADVLAEFSRRYRTGLPDAVLFLDVEPAEALRRSATRTGASSELHEDPEILARLRAIYEAALQGLERDYPEMAVHRLEVTDLSLDETLDAVLDLLGGSVGRVAGLP
jgi:thymidylate kinase